jgi:hypothetical protein
MRLLVCRRGSLSAELAVVAGACAVVIIIAANVCLFLIRAAQFDRITGEVARSCVYADAPWSAQEGIERSMGFDQATNGQFQVRATQGDGIITFELVYRPFLARIAIGSLSITTPEFKRTKAFAIPSVGYKSDGSSW